MSEPVITFVPPRPWLTAEEKQVRQAFADHMAALEKDTERKRKYWEAVREASKYMVNEWDNI